MTKTHFRNKNSLQRARPHRGRLVAGQQSVIVLLLAGRVIDGVLDTHFAIPSESPLAHPSRVLLPHWIPRGRLHAENGRSRCSSVREISRRLLNPVKPKSRHLLRERTRQSVSVAVASSTTTGAKVYRVRGKPCRRPGKTRFPGNPARLRTRHPEPAPSSQNAQFAPLRSCGSRFTLASYRPVSKKRL